MQPLFLGLLIQLAQKTDPRGKLDSLEIFLFFFNKHNCRIIALPVPLKIYYIKLKKKKTKKKQKGKKRQAFSVAN